jgi:hypothetical protein
MRDQFIAGVVTQHAKVLGLATSFFALVACGGSGSSNAPAPSISSSAAVSSASVVSSSSLPASSSRSSASLASSSSVASQGAVINVGPLNTGTTSAPVYVYYDLDTARQLTLTEAEAATNTHWDIAFRRTKVFLNAKAATPVKAFATGNNADFFNANKEPIKEKFIAATAQAELADFTAVTATAIPAATSFISDKEEHVIGGKFYRYNMTTHAVSAATDKSFIVFSDGNYTKIRAKALTSAGRTMSTITVGIALQDVARGDTQFLAEVERTFDAIACTGNLYIDLDTQTTVNQNDAWDIYFPCVTVGTNTGASFELNIAADASAIPDATPAYTGIDKTTHNFLGFQPNLSKVLFFDTFPWYQYNLEGTHLLYSQYQVYLVKTASTTYKLQLTSYYNATGASGHYSFRYQSL